MAYVGWSGDLQVGTWVGATKKKLFKMVPKKTIKNNCCTQQAITMHDFKKLLFCLLGLLYYPLIF